MQIRIMKSGLGAKYPRLSSGSRPGKELSANEHGVQLLQKKAVSGLVIHLDEFIDGEQYAIWKEECRKMNAVIGSGRIITAPIITEEGVPIQDPIVLLEANPDKDLSTVQHDGDDGQGENDDNQREKESTVHDDLGSNCGAPELDKMESAPMDKKEIQWKLTLHQIGMSDLCSPMIVLLEDEADAFWCFERLMCRLRRNFRCTESSVGVEQQLHSLASITQVVDPKLHQHLGTSNFSPIPSEFVSVVG